MLENVEFILEDVEIPRFVAVRQRLDGTALTDIRARMREQLDDDLYRSRVRSGMRVGITVGSRGINNMPTIVRELADWVRDQGATAYVIPAMGSHGGATAEGQEEMLRNLGFTPEATGCQILSSMETVELGTTPEGWTCYFDKFALGLDATIVLNRVKAHTDIVGEVESGLEKVTAVGLGKHVGAMQVHRRGLQNAEPRIRSIARFAFEHGNIVFGVAVTEGQLDQTKDIVCVPVEKIAEVEPRILAESRAGLPRLLVSDIDVLVVDRMGKNISGDGMDPNVIGKSLVGVKNPEMRIGKIAALDLTDETHGNCVGSGLADVITKRMYDKFDFDAMYTNGVTANALNSVNIPPFMLSQRSAIRAAIRASLIADYSQARIVRIPDTLHLEHIWVSEPMLSDVEAHPDLEVLGEPAPLPFDEFGDLF